jgi:DNA processing protein
VRGALPAGRAVAIVGTRASTPEAEGLAAELAGGLARAGFAVWSGGALGIDAAAHRGALAAGGLTVAVLGGGLARPFPRENVPLFHRIVDAGGAVISPFDDLEPARHGGFHFRNGLVAAVAELVVVVECPEVSGALSTAKKAQQLGRIVGFVPHAPWSPAGLGCVRALRDGAPVVASVDDALALLGASSAAPPRERPKIPRVRSARARAASPSVPSSHAPSRVEPSSPPPSSDPPPDLDAAERAVWAALAEPRGLDGLCEALGRSASELSALLLGLELRGVVVDDGSRVYQRGR